MKKIILVVIAVVSLVFLILLETQTLILTKGQLTIAYPVLGFMLGVVFAISLKKKEED